MSKHRHLPRTPGFKVIDGAIHEQVLVRQVLEPGKRKAALHPWALLLWASRNGTSAEDLTRMRARAGIAR